MLMNQLIKISNQSVEILENYALSTKFNTQELF